MQLNINQRRALVALRRVWVPEHVEDGVGFCMDFGKVLTIPGSEWATLCFAVYRRDEKFEYFDYFSHKRGVPKILTGREQL